MFTLDLCIGILNALLGIYFLLVGLGKIKFNKSFVGDKNLFYSLLGGALLLLSLFRIYCTIIYK